MTESQIKFVFSHQISVRMQNDLKKAISLVFAYCQQMTLQNSY